MRVLLVSPADDAFGGVASVVGHLARHLRSRGHEVMFFHRSRSLKPERKTTAWGFPGVQFRLQMPFGRRHPAISLALFLVWFPSRLVQLIWLLRRHRIDIINVHYPDDYCFYFGLCRRLLRLKLVASIHGADILPGGEPRPRYSPLLRFFLNSADLIVSPSRSYRRDFLDIFPQLAGKAVFIHNGIELSELERPPENEPPERKPYALCIAAHNVKKGLDVLIRAAALLTEADPPFEVRLVGDGPLRPQLESLSRSLRLEERVRFLGWRQRPEIAKLLHGADIVVLPSRSEPFGIAVIEGLACRKAVVATAVGGIPEIIEHGRNGLLVAPDDPAALAGALATLWRDPVRRRELGENGYATVRERFRTQRAGTEYETAFEGLLADDQQVIHDLLGRANGKV